MNPSTWTRAREIFDEVVDLPSAERETRVEILCAGEPEVRGEVERMLEADTASDSVTPVVNALFADADARHVATEGARVGDFTILRRVASGGMGTVFEARQEHPPRRVALKLLAVGLGSEDAAQRFRLEAEALARLAHPSIATIYASGTHGDGLLAVPWLAMEFVEEARTIVEFAQARGLSVRERVELFVRVCDAVQHAHEKGVIHRDLKPGNVLVDRTGNPKVIDFGVARVREEGAPATTGQLSGTPAYMSPEQWDEPRSVDTRSDVYALGVVLFELLTGELPSGATTEEPAESFRARRDAPARRLSAVDPRLARDLDWIAAKAIERERERRYRTVAELAADLQRHLAGDVVIARPPTAAYRVSRFVRRHRVGVAGAAVVVASLVGGIVASLVGLSKAQAAETKAVESGEFAKKETARVRAEWERAEATLALLQGLFRAPRKSVRGSKVSASEVLADGVEDVLANPDVGAPARHALLSTIVDAFGQLGERERLESTASRLVEADRAAFGADDSRTWDARVCLARAEVTNGKVGPARALLAEAISRYLEFLREPDGRGRGYVVALAQVAWMCDERKGAEQLLRAVVASASAGGDEALVLEGETHLALFLALSLRTDEAEDLLQRIAPRIQRHPEDHELRYAEAILRAELAYRRGEMRAAISALRDVRDRVAARWGPSNSTALRETIKLSVWLSSRGDEAAALEEAQRAVEAARDSLADDSPLSLDASDALALALGRANRLGEAIDLKGRVLAGRERAFGRDHLRTIRSRKELAFLLLQSKRYDEGESLAREAFADAERALGAENAETANALFVLGQAVLNLGRHDEAEGLLAEASRRTAVAVPGERWRTAAVDVIRGRALTSLGRTDEAEEVLVRALSLLREAQGEDGRSTIRALEYLAMLYDKTEKTEKARETRALLEGAKAVKSRPAR